MATTAPAPIPATRPRSPPRGACGMGTYPIPTSTLDDARPSSRSRSPTNLIDSITRAVSRSMSRPRGRTSPSPEIVAAASTSDETLAAPGPAPTSTEGKDAAAAPAPAPRSRSREPRGAAGLGDFAKSRSREASRARTTASASSGGAAGASSPPTRESSLARVREEPRGAAGLGGKAHEGEARGRAEAGVKDGGQGRSGSVSRARAAVGRMWDAVKPQDEVVPDERTWGAAGMGDWRAAKERSQSRGRRAE
ncbi:hypothetical protein JCM9279_005328 [Rhodotorula babjevae]